MDMYVIIIKKIFRKDELQSYPTRNRKCFHTADKRRHCPWTNMRGPTGAWFEFQIVQSEVVYVDKTYCGKTHVLRRNLAIIVRLHVSKADTFFEFLSA